MFPDPAKLYPKVKGYQVVNPLKTHLIEPRWFTCLVCERPEIEIVRLRIPCLGCCTRCNHPIRESLLGNICLNCGKTT